MCSLQARQLTRDVASAQRAVREVQSLTTALTAPPSPSGAPAPNPASAPATPAPTARRPAYTQTLARLHVVLGLALLAGADATQAAIAFERALQQHASVEASLGVY